MVDTKSGWQALPCQTADPFLASYLAVRHVLCPRVSLGFFPLGWKMDTLEVLLGEGKVSVERFLVSPACSAAAPYRRVGTASSFFPISILFLVTSLAIDGQVP